jgi:hypothetical protein
MEDYPEIGATHTHTERTTPNREVKQLEKRINNTQKNPKWQSDAYRVQSKRTEGFFFLFLLFLLKNIRLV